MFCLDWIYLQLFKRLPAECFGCQRGISSSGRALAWHVRGDRFDPGILHPVKPAMNFAGFFSLCYKSGGGLTEVHPPSTIKV
jgi:hypothetical protein